VSFQGLVTCLPSRESPWHARKRTTSCTSSIAAGSRTSRVIMARRSLLSSSEAILMLDRKHRSWPSIIANAFRSISEVTLIGSRRRMSLRSCSRSCDLHVNAKNGHPFLVMSIIKRDISPSDFDLLPPGLFQDRYLTHLLVAMTSKVIVYAFKCVCV
jgi:hypothetical protein